MSTAPASAVELRCPHSMGKLLARTHLTGPAPAVVPPNLIEVACNNCARAHRAAGRPCARVLHRFNLLGEIVATEVVPG